MADIRKVPAMVLSSSFREVSCTDGCYKLNWTLARTNMKSECTKILQKIQSPKIELDELGKAKSFRLFSIARPFMRGFHASWFCFFVAFTSWFGIQPLLPTIRKELGLTKVQLAHSGMASVAATIAVRVFVGPLCDKFGPRRVMSALLLCGSIPMALSGLIQSATGLIVLRFFIGVLGGSFVPCQFWTTAMFNSKVVGTANALVGGWGNLGGGVTFLFMPGVFELIKLCGADEFLAWKIAVAVPAVICVILGISIIFTTDDCPQGNWNNRILPGIYHKEIIIPDPEVNGPKEYHNKLLHTPDKTIENGDAEATSYSDISPSKDDTSSSESNHSCLSNYLTIGILVSQYALSFGVEISVNTILNLYFLYKFKIEGCVDNDGQVSNGNNTMLLLNETSMVFENQSATPVMAVMDSDINKCSILDQNTASLISSLFGLMNLFARGLGGMFSDVLRKYHDLSGRLLALFICVASEGILLIIFSQVETISIAIVTMIVTSIFVQMSEGATFAVVPYVLLHRVGLVAGLVGSGGNSGALLWNVVWSQLVIIDPSRYFWIVGITVFCGSFLNFLAVIQGFRIIHICKKNTN